MIAKKLKVICNSQSKNIKLRKYKNCSDGSDYQKGCDNYIIKTINHEMYFQKVQKLHYLLLMINDII